MPRIGRLHIPGGYYHVIGRGLEKRDIFESRIDKLDFLDRFGENLVSADARCLAWALMSNHYHLLIIVGQKPLSKLMAPVLGGYAGHYNRRHDRCGYVFQNRYKSILVDKDSYLLELVRYIHLNPVAASVVENVDKLGSYPWTGHAGMLNKHKQEWHSTDITLANFGANRQRARSAYLRFMKQGALKPRPKHLSGGGLIRSHGRWQGLDRLRKEHTACIGDERILGSGEFVESVLRQDDLCKERSLTLARQGWDLEKLAQWLCENTGVQQHQLQSKARGGKLAEAKASLGYLASTELGLTVREMADFLSISQPSASAWVKKGEKLCQ
ncbi:unnamed protein product, partial [Discosporangium mesarthrocarpum]